MDSFQIILKSTPSFLKNLVGVPSPIIWANKITFNCNLYCKFCPHWTYTPKDELSTAQFLKFMQEARDLGVVVNAFEGGEPLLRDDLPILMKESKILGMMNTVITNGTLLEKRKEEIIPYVDAIVISIDGEKETHDKIRGKPGTYDKAIKAASEISSECKLVISSVINKLNLNELESIAKIGNELDSPVSFCPAVSFSEVEDLTVTHEELVGAAKELLELKQKGFNILNSDAYLKSLINDKNITCRVADFFLTTDPSGNLIIPCSHWFGRFKSHKTANMPLKEAWRSKEIQRLREESKKCNRCHIIDSRESSIILAGRFDVLIKFYEQWNNM